MTFAVKLIPHKPTYYYAGQTVKTKRVRYVVYLHMACVLGYFARVGIFCIHVSTAMQHIAQIVGFIDILSSVCKQSHNIKIY